MATVYALPPNFGSIYFETYTGEPFNGSVTIYPTRVYRNSPWWGYFGTDPSIPTTLYDPFTYLKYNIDGGYIIETVNATVASGVDLIDYYYSCHFEYNDGRQGNITIGGSGYPSITSPYVVPEPQGFPVSLEINITPESTLPLDLYVDGAKTSESGTSQILFSGVFAGFEIKLHDEILFQKAVLADGNITTNLQLATTQKQLHLQDFEIGTGNITNLSGRVIPEMNIYSM
jgi:hypothetical protein